MGFGRMLAMAGVAAAGVAWFKSRRREQTEGDEMKDMGTTQATPDPADDPVDQAIAESFPASDPPSFAGSPRDSGP